MIGPVLPRGYRTVPVHGKYSRYVVFKCRCDSCRTAVKMYRRRATRQRAYKGRRLVASPEESKQLRDRVQALIEKQGWHQKALAAEAGLPHETFQGWYAGRKKNPRLPTLTAIEAMLDRLENGADALSPAQRAQRAVDRLNILNGMGWTLAQIAEVADSGANLCQIVNGRQSARPVTVAKLDRAWEQLTGPGPKPPRQELKGRASKHRISQSHEAEPVRRAAVPISEASELVHQLMEKRDHTHGTIAAATGLSSKTIGEIARKTRTQVSDNTMTALEELTHQEALYV